MARRIGSEWLTSQNFDLMIGLAVSLAGGIIWSGACPMQIRWLDSQSWDRLREGGVNWPSLSKLKKLFGKTVGGMYMQFPLRDVCQLAY